MIEVYKPYSIGRENCSPEFKTLELRSYSSKLIKASCTAIKEVQ